MAQTTLHLRSETKLNERRTALTPATTKALIEAGYSINVERCTQRVFKDEEYEIVGANLVPAGTWSNAPDNHIIIGLKELPQNDFALVHDHVQFGHCYKGQKNWDTYLSRFVRGGGTLYDIEFLTDSLGKRIAAFGYYAGFGGAAVSILSWAHQINDSETLLPPVMPSHYSSQRDLEDAVRDVLSHAVARASCQPPRVIVIGALGRCGTGAIDCCLAAGIPESSIVKWDIADTAKGGPFFEINASDIFINCIYLREPIPPFVTLDSLSKPGRKLRVTCDVSCDPSDRNNPIPIYNECSSFERPTIPVNISGDGPDMTINSIDHLPSLISREASEHLSSLLLPILLLLDRRDHEDVWLRNRNLFLQMSEKLQKHS